MNKFKWEIKSPASIEKINQLSEEINISGEISTILIQRGINDFNEAKAFFNPLIEDILDPFLMKDMQKAIALINKTIEEGNKIIIYGDYDVDGTTSVALVYSYLKEFTNKIEYYIPDRHKEGYGISTLGIKYAIDNNVSLIIALDCGIKAIETIEMARKHNIDFIVCDHHNPGEILPNANAILNPKQIGCNYPFKELTGCGIGFKLVQAHNAKKGNSINNILSYLDLVVVSIAADMVPMVEENRTLAFYGLKILNKSPRIGLKVFIENIKNEEIDISKIVFLIAPKINAAGRIKHAKSSVDLLISTTYLEAKEILNQIEAYNNTRRNLDQSIAEEALKQIATNNEQENYSTVVYSDNWNIGVLGIVASRLIETYYRPTLVFAKNEGKWVASARSTATFDLYEALSKFEHLFERYGGHKFAAGLTILEENLQEFKDKFEKHLKSTVKKEERTPTLYIDTELKLNKITSQFLLVVNRISPFGPLNLRPTFVSKEVNIEDLHWLGKDKNHLKCKVKVDESKTFQAIYFKCNFSIQESTDAKYDIVYNILENNWQGNKAIQLNILDIKKSTLFG
ncbi:MAG: single-stranded-DNA-specific exonuclease RecJ [Solirubrobacteraceae bacterium]